ncbi:kinase-like domain-containing protein [Crepidotus variabilis]|uniref:Kinase-like domain-containing protein n=1 Tax=Crepidotus variabilis TaxID=179855 RepID=A0A9P6JSV6_9AGAR|nr:kinase-like domain-containing protein [Crepidotus variabilis]
MLRIASATVAPLNLAAALSGVPFVGAAGVVVQEIVKSCEEAKIHKQQSKLLSAKCVRILNTFSDRTKDLEGSQLQQMTDEVMMILEGVLKRTKRYSSYSSVVTFLKKADIKEGLDRCNAELDTAMQLFQALLAPVMPIALIVVSRSAAITNDVLQRDMQGEARRDKAEIRDLLLNILHMPGNEMHDLQRQGPDAAADLMAAGQEELRRLRDKNLQATSRNSLSRPASAASNQIPDSQAYLEYQRGLIKLHRETGIPPTIKLLNGEVKRTSELAVIGGTYSDIWMGTWLAEEKVALKALRNTRTSDPRANQRFENEINTWSSLKHDNILAFYGIVTDLGQHVHMVSPWQDNGNVLGSHPDANRLQLVSGAAQGLDYLHSKKIIHGNMKCANILVSSKGHACICDFGMSKVIEEVTERSASLTLTEGGSARWLAPELIEGKAPSKEADVYSFAMAILELMTGKHPYADCKRDAQVIHSIVVLKKTPARPQLQGAAALDCLSDELWGLMLRCWCKEAAARPQMTEVSSSLVEISRTTPTAGLTDGPRTL